MALRILVIDDSSTIQKVIKIAFSRFHVEISSANSFIEGVGDIKRLEPEIVLIDAPLLVSRTSSEWQALLKDTRRQKIIVLMGSYDNVDEGKLKAAGFTAIIKKPFESGEIVKTIESALGIKLEPKPSLEVLSDPKDSLPPLPVSSGSDNLQDLQQQLLTITENPPYDSALPASLELPPLPGSESQNDYQHQGFSDETRKGRKAFDEGHNHSKHQPIELSSPGKPKKSNYPVQHDFNEGGNGQLTPVETEPEFSESRIEHILEGLIEKKLGHTLKHTIEEFCSKHFELMLRDILVAELRRLAEEKARHLVDH